MLDVGRHPKIELMAYSEVEQVEGPEPVDDPFRCIRAVRAVDAEDKSQASKHGFRGEVRGKIREEHHPSPQFQIPDREGAAVVRDFPLIRTDQPGKAAEEGRLAGPVGSEHGDDLSWGEAEADAVEGADPTIGLVDGRQFDVHRGVIEPRNAGWFHRLHGRHGAAGTSGTYPRIKRSGIGIERSGVKSRLDPDSDCDPDTEGKATLKIPTRCGVVPTGEEPARQPLVARVGIGIGIAIGIEMFEVKSQARS